jgi:MATE family multidrug resistance protein
MVLWRKVTGWVRPRGDGADLRRDVLRLALPATAEQMLGMMVGIVDTFLVGHLGAPSLAAVGLANQWIFLAGTFFGAVATGSTALIARFIGAKEPQQANQVLRQSVLLGVLIGVFAMALGLTLARPAVLLLGAPEEAVDLSITYLRIVSCAMILAPLMYLGNASLRGAGDTRTPLYIMLVVNALNIAVAWTMINGLFGLPKMGVAGSALGAAIAQATGGLLVTAVLLKGRGQIRLRLAHFGPDWEMIRRVMRVGLPTGVENLLFRVGNMAYVTVLTSLGVEAYAANQVAINGWSLSFMPGFGFAVAATTLVGQALGAKEPEAAQQRGFTSYKIGALLMGAIGVLFVIFPAQIMGFFTNDPEVIALGTMPLRVMGLVQPFLAANMIFAGALRGAGDTRYPMVVTAIGIWLVRLPLAYLLAVPLGWGLVGAWTAMSLDTVVRGTLNFRRFRSGRWKATKV